MHWYRGSGRGELPWLPSASATRGAQSRGVWGEMVSRVPPAAWRDVEAWGCAEVFTAPVPVPFSCWALLLEAIVRRFAQEGGRSVLNRL